MIPDILFGTHCIQERNKKNQTPNIQNKAFTKQGSEY